MSVARRLVVPLLPAQTPPFFRALPAYMGGKRKLAPFIFAQISDVIPRQEWADTFFLDPFCGGGAVALYAKAQGFRVIASDLAERAAVTARALIANSSVRLRLEDVLGLFEERSGRTIPMPADLMSPMQAAWFANALAVASSRAEPHRSLLQLVLIKALLRSMPMSSPKATDAKAAAAGDFDRISSRRLPTYLNARRLLLPSGLMRLAEEVNLGVFGGPGVACKGDALDVIRSTPADILYLDPPYPRTRAYGFEYGALDHFLGDVLPTRAPPSLDELLEAARDVRLVVLSYGGPSHDLVTLTATVARHREVRRALAVPYAHLQSIASEKKNASNKELLVIAGR
jgi:SAM-dependent methyltransferase